MQSLEGHRHRLEDYFSGTAAGVNPGAMPADLGLSSKMSPMGALEDLILQKGARSEFSSVGHESNAPICPQAAKQEPQQPIVKDLGVFNSILEMNNPFIHWLFVELGNLLNGQLPLSELSFLLPDYISHIKDYVHAIESNQFFVRMRQETLVLLKIVIALLENIVGNNPEIHSNQHFQHFLEALKQFKLGIEW